MMEIKSVRCLYVSNYYTNIFFLKFVLSVLLLLKKKRTKQNKKRVEDQTCWYC